MKRVIFVHGDKGGIGKTEVAKRTAAALLERGITLIDGDAKNPGLYNSFNAENAPVRRHNVLRVEGREELFETIASTKGDVLVDLPAGASAATEKMSDGGTAEGTIDLGMLLAEVQAQLVVMFVIDQNREPIQALRDELDVFPDTTKWIVVRNHFHERPFDLFNGSNTKARVEERGGILIDMARLDPAVTELMATEKSNLIRIQDSSQASFIQKLRARTALREWQAELVKAGLLND